MVAELEQRNDTVQSCSCEHETSDLRDIKIEPGHFINSRCDSMSGDKEAPGCSEGQRHNDEAGVDGTNGEVFVKTLPIYKFNM